jgi:hypothetical protein
MFDTKLANHLSLSNRVTLKCWGGGLVYGSLCRFELGNKITDIIDGEPSLIGSATLWLDCDDWKIKSADKVIADSDVIDAESFSVLMQKYFLNSLLIDIQLLKKDMVINFESHLSIIITINKDTSYDLMTLFLPDGKIIYARDNLYLSTQESLVRKNCCQSLPLKIQDNKSLASMKLPKNNTNTLSFNNKLRFNYV